MPPPSDPYSRYLPPISGIQVDVRGRDVDQALRAMTSQSMDSGLMRDFTYRSPLAGDTRRYEKPTQRRQRIERKGKLEFKSKMLLTLLRTVLFKKNRG